LEPKANRDVAIAPSTIKNAGFGLFATRPLTEGSSPCSFGKCYDNALNHIVHNDTGYDDGSNFSIGNRNEDYGCWCNDPLDESLVNCTIVHDGNNHHRLKIRWDVETGEELFIEYGEDFWKEHYWKAPERVRRRYPTIIPTHPAPAEGEDHCMPDSLKFPKDFAQTRTKQWNALILKKRKNISDCSKRVARIVCSRYAMEKLSIMAEANATENEIVSNIKKLNKLMLPVSKGRKRTKVQFQEDVEHTSESKAQQRKSKVTKSKSGIK
jgi:hypothetical protein